MKRFSLFLLAAGLLSLTSCVKSIIENTKNNLATDFTLKLNRTDAAGNLIQKIENALNQNNAAKYTASYFVKQSSIQLSIGGVQTTTVKPGLSADIHFLFTSDPVQITGTYNFPADNARISFLLSENENGNTTIRSLPVSGKLTVTYDAATKTLSGNIENLSYHQPLNSNYVSEFLSGKFNHVIAGK